MKRPSLCPPVASVAEVDRFATRAHAGQKRLSGRDYIWHPREMAWLARQLGYGDDRQRELLLHDTVEDTGTTRHDLRRLRVPRREINRVLLLSHPKGMPRDRYIPEYIKPIAEDVDAAVDKLFDLDHNLDKEPLSAEVLAQHPHKVEKIGLHWQAMDMLLGVIEEQRPNDAMVGYLKSRIASGITAINFELTPVSSLPEGYEFRYLKPLPPH